MANGVGFMNKFKKGFQFFRHLVGLVAGVPDYEKYLEHMKSHHPDQKPMSRKDFFDQVQKDKYGGSRMNRCC